jgi:hypothetical protein
MSARRPGLAPTSALLALEFFDILHQAPELAVVGIQLSAGLRGQTETPFLQLLPLAFVRTLWRLM